MAALKLYGSMEIETFQKGDFVFHQGDVGDRFYMVYTGSFEVRKTMTLGNQMERETKVTQLNAGDCFGERALKEADTRAGKCNHYLK